MPLGPNLAPKEALNELIAGCWSRIHKDYTKRAEIAFDKMIAEWKFEPKPGKARVGSVKLFRYSMYMKATRGRITTSIDSPPGYERLEDDFLRLAVPLQNKWSVSASCTFGGEFRVWAKGTVPYRWTQQIVVTQKVEISNFRFVSEIDLDTSTEVDRPYLKKIRPDPTFLFRLSGFIELAIPFPIAGIKLEAAAGEGYSLEKEVMKIGARIRNIGGGEFSGKVVLKLLPKIEIGFKGKLSFKLPMVETQEFEFNVSIPTGLTLPEALLENIPIVPKLPVVWGEKCKVPIGTPIGYDFLAEANEIEERVAAHLHDGVIDEIRYKPLIRGGRRGKLTPKAYPGYHDTAIWTGHYLAAEAFRYASATTKPEKDAALSRVKYVLGGIKMLFQVTEVPGLLARSVLPEDSSLPWDDAEDIRHPERYYKHVRVDGKYWQGFGRADKATSRDSYAGLMMGLAYAYKLVERRDVQDTIREIVTEAAKYVLANKWNVVTPKAVKRRTARRTKKEEDLIITTFLHMFHYQLAILRIGKTVNEQEFGPVYDKYAQAAKYVWISIWGSTWDPMSKYYKFNLQHAVMGVLLFLEEDAELRAFYMKAFRMLRRATGHHRNAYFNLVRVLAELPGDRPAAMNEPALSNPHITLKEETRALLEEWLLRREAVPGPNGLPVEKTPDVDYLVNLVPSKIQEYINKFPDVTGGDYSEPEESILSKCALPIHKRHGSGMDYVWQRNPFSTKLTLKTKPAPRPAGVRRDPRDDYVIEKDKPHNEGPAIDYLLAAWMGAYLGLLKSNP